MIKNNAKQTIGYYWMHLRKFKSEVIGTMLILPLTVLINNFLPPLVLAMILNKLASHNYVSHGVWQSFGSDIILYAILVLLGGVVSWRAFDVFFWRLEGKMERSIAQDVFQNLLSKSANFHANKFSGSLVSNTNKIMTAFIRLMDTTLFQVLPLVYGLIFVVIIMGKRAPIYTIILLVVSFVYIFSSFKVTRKVRDLSAKQAEAESEQTGRLADAITNVLAIKSYARTDFEIKRFKSATDTTYKRLIDIYRAFQLQQIYFNGIASSLSIISLIAAVVSVVSFNANLATAFLIFNYTANIISQLFGFSNNALRAYNRSFGDASEMVKILGQEAEVKDPIEPEAVNIKDSSIKFNNVTFAHDGGSGSIFKDFNIDILNGEKIGLVGHSGSGKTTFTSLLLRYADISSGEITIGGQNIAKISQDDLHNLIAYVPQEPLLFHRTIEENIAYGKPKASPSEVQTAAIKAHADEFIDLLPQRYKTLVGERGVKLSGGQRQRIAIARAIIKQAPVIVLDEATSALDSESEVLIQDALWKLMENKTTIVIAHRLSTIQKMDRIIVLNKGNIEEQGSHKQLLENNGIYAKLWAHQSGGFIEE